MENQAPTDSFDDCIDRDTVSAATKTMKKQVTLEYSNVDEFSREDFADSSSNINDRASKIESSRKVSSKPPKLSEMMKNEELRDSGELIDQMEGDTEFKFSLTHGATKLVDGITPKNIQKTISSP